jgi:hypothetical protein
MEGDAKGGKPLVESLRILLTMSRKQSVLCIGEFNRKDEIYKYLYSSSGVFQHSVNLNGIRNHQTHDLIVTRFTDGASTLFQLLRPGGHLIFLKDEDDYRFLVRP